MTPEDLAKLAAVAERDTLEGCVVCGGRLALIGDLGQFRWLRCRACGCEQHERSDE